MLSTKDLTGGERLYLERKRRGVSQRGRSKELGVTLFVYRKMEVSQDVSVPRVALGRLLPHEGCIILRRRSGLTTSQVAEGVGCSRWWLRLMERGDEPCEPLVTYWTA